MFDSNDAVLVDVWLDSLGVNLDDRGRLNLMGTLIIQHGLINGRDYAQVGRGLEIRKPVADLLARCGAVKHYLTIGDAHA